MRRVGEVGTGARRSGRASRGDEGYSLVELVVAMLILTVGILAMAATTAYVIQATAASEFETQRAAAFQSAIEEARSLPFEDVSEGTVTVGPMTAEWTADPAGATSQSTKEITVVVTGPGRPVAGSGGGRIYQGEVETTHTYRLMRRDNP